MAYIKTDWVSGDVSLNAENLQKMENQIVNLTDITDDLKTKTNVDYQNQIDNVKTNVAELLEADININSQINTINSAIGVMQSNQNEQDSTINSLQQEVDNYTSTYIAPVTDLQSNLGNISLLETATKSDVVSAINEVNAKATTIANVDQLQSDMLTLQNDVDTLKTEGANLTPAFEKIGDLTNLQTDNRLNTVSAINELFGFVSDGKNSIASAITGKGVTTLGSDTFATMSSNIDNIEQIITGYQTHDLVSSDHIEKKYDMENINSIGKIKDIIYPKGEGIVKSKQIGDYVYIMEWKSGLHKYKLSDFSLVWKYTDTSFGYLRDFTVDASGNVILCGVNKTVKIDGINGNKTYESTGVEFKGVQTLVTDDNNYIYLVNLNTYNVSKVSPDFTSIIWSIPLSNTLINSTGYLLQEIQSAYVDITSDNNYIGVVAKEDSGLNGKQVCYRLSTTDGSITEIEIPASASGVNTGTYPMFATIKGNKLYYADRNINLNALYSIDLSNMSIAKLSGEATIDIPPVWDIYGNMYITVLNGRVIKFDSDDNLVSETHGLFPYMTEPTAAYMSSTNKLYVANEYAMSNNLLVAHTENSVLKYKYKNNYNVNPTYIDVINIYANANGEIMVVSKFNRGVSLFAEVGDFQGYQIMENTRANTFIGSATTDNVLTGKTFLNDTGEMLTGTMPLNSGLTITPDATVQTIPEGYHDGTTVVDAVLDASDKIYGVGDTLTDENIIVKPQQKWYITITGAGNVYQLKAENDGFVGRNSGTIFKSDYNGNKIWETGVYSGAIMNYRKVSDGYLLAHDHGITKIDFDGNQIFEFVNFYTDTGSMESYRFMDAIQLSDGTIIARNVIALYKISADGTTVLWEYNWDNATYGKAYYKTTLAEDTDGILTTTTASNNSRSGGYLIKLDFDGNQIFTFNHNRGDLNYVYPESDGYVCAGYRYFFKIDKAGTSELWSRNETWAYWFKPFIKMNDHYVVWGEDNYIWHVDFNGIETRSIYLPSDAMNVYYDGNYYYVLMENYYAKYDSNWTQIWEYKHDISYTVIYSNTISNPAGDSMIFGTRSSARLFKGYKEYEIIS